MKALVVCIVLIGASAGLAAAQRTNPPSIPPPKTGPFPLPPIGPKAAPTTPDAAKAGDGGKKATPRAGVAAGTLLTLDGCIESEAAGKRYFIASSKNPNAPKVLLEASDDVKANVNHRVAIVGTSRPAVDGQGASVVKVDKLEVLKTSCEK